MELTRIFFSRDNTGEVAGLLIKHGANVNENLNSFLATPMHLAAAYGNDAVASKIIELCGPRCDLTLKVKELNRLHNRNVHLYSGKHLLNTSADCRKYVISGIYMLLVGRYWLLFYGCVSQGLRTTKFTNLIG